MINKLHRSARIREVDSASDKLMSIYNNNDKIKGNQNLNQIFGEIRTLSDEITQVINKERYKSQLSELNDARNIALRNLNSAIGGYCAMPSPQISESAKAIKKVFDRFGLKIIRQSYVEESSSIESLLMDLSDNEIRNNINQLQGLADCVQQVRDSETAFKQSWIEFNSVRANVENLRSAIKVKNDLLRCINLRLINYLNTMQDFDSNIDEDFINEISELIKRFNQTIDSRKSKDDEDKSESSSLDTL